MFPLLLSPFAVRIGAVHPEKLLAVHVLAPVRGIGEEIVGAVGQDEVTLRDIAILDAAEFDVQGVADEIALALFYGAVADDDAVGVVSRAVLVRIIRLVVSDHAFVLAFRAFERAVRHGIGVALVRARILPCVHKLPLRGGVIARGEGDCEHCRNDHDRK